MLKLVSFNSSKRLFSSSFFIREKYRNSNSKVFMQKNNKKKTNLKAHELLAIMPKEEAHLEDIRKMRMEKRTKRFLVQPNTVYWQVLGSGSYGGPTSLLLNTDHRKYLFNCGEGTQRLTSQLSIGKALAQLEHVFITSKTWRHLGGLTGVCLSGRAAGAPDITIHGPPGCMDLYQATKGFAKLYEFNVYSHTANDGVFEDGAVNVEQVKLHRSVNKKCPDIPESWEDDDNEIVKGDDYDNTVQAYVCKFSPKPGKLNIAKCVECGVKPGPMLGLLKAGKDVTLEDGRIVRSSDVVGDTSPSSSFLVIDIPDMEYLDSLESCDKLQNIDNLQTVFHFSPDEVVDSPRYKKWLEGMGENVNHILLNESCRGLGLPDVTAYTHKLRKIRSEFFPDLLGAEDDISCTQVEKFSSQVIKGFTGLRLNVRPSNLPTIDLSSLQRFDEDESNKEMMEGTKIADLDDREEYVRMMKKDLEYAGSYSPEPLATLTAKLSAIEGKASTIMYPVVTFLGTGSSVPSKYRNVTGILLETQPGSFIMLDCGEGTMSQLVRMKGREETERVLMGLKGVYISHMHADHHLGLIKIIQLRERAFISRGLEVDNLYIISTRRLSEFLTEYHSKFEPILSNTELVKCEKLILFNVRDEETMVEQPTVKHQLLPSEIMQKVLSDLGLLELYTSKALHCPHAFCLALRTVCGDYKVAYSGDTRPYQPFHDICMWGGAPDLLIHEATMEHFMMYDALIKKHSTFTEAIEVGEKVGAKFTLLTHFSQRYAKMPSLEEIQGKPDVGITFDTMVVRPDNMKMIPSIYPALARLLWDYKQDLDDRAEHYKARYVDGGALASQLDFDDFQTPLQEKKTLVDKLAKKHQDKQLFFNRVNKRKLKEQEEATSAKIEKN